MDQPLFEAIIVPHRSLSPRALSLLLLVIAVLCCAIVAGTILRGAWPVGGFTVVALLLAAILFRNNANGARAAEFLLLSEDSLRIIRTDASGNRTEKKMPPAWLTVRLTERAGRVPLLTVSAREVTEEVGSCLGETEKRDLARALEAALERRRNPRFDNPQLRE